MGGGIRHNRRSIVRFVIFICVCWPVIAGEYAILGSGFRVHADSHVRSGDVILLKANGGEISLPAADVVRFEAEEAPVQAIAGKDLQQAATVDSKALVNMAADASALPRELVHSVARAESGYRADAVSPKGAIGLMQLMPGTASELRADPRDPAQNAWAGAVYLRNLLEKYHGSVARALAAYNAGPGAVDKYHGVPPYRETQAYVRRVLADYKKQMAAGVRKSSPAGD